MTRADCSRFGRKNSNKQIRAQVRIAIDEADKLFFLVDGLNGIHPIDIEIAKPSKKIFKRKTIILAANKIDNTKRIYTVDFFIRLDSVSRWVYQLCQGRTGCGTS